MRPNEFGKSAAPQIAHVSADFNDRMSASLWIAALECRYRLHFDEKIFLDETIDYKKRVGWIAVRREHRGEQIFSYAPEIRDVLRVHKIGRKLHDVGERRLDRL